MVPVGGIDDGISDIVRHLLESAQVIIHPKFDDVNVFLRLRRYCRLDFGNSGNSLVHSRKSAITASIDKSLTRCINTSKFRPARSLFVANLENKVLIRSHTENGRDPVGSVSPQVFLDVFTRKELGILRQINRV